MSRPGKLNVSVDGIYTIGGEIVVPLRGEVQREGERCYAEGCAAAVLLYWVKGRNASLPAGSLLTSRVERVTSFDRSSVRRLVSLLSKSEVVDVGAGSVPGGARLHVYGVSESIGDRPDWNVTLDGKGVGSLSNRKYGCLNLTPGPHVLQVGVQQLWINAQTGTEHFARFTETRGRRSLVPVDGYQFEAGALEPAKLKNGVSCWADAA